jgi:hypothetical protein
MRKLYVLALVFSSMVICGLASQPITATAGSVVISQVQIGDVSSSRLVEIYNNTNDSIDVTNWCVYHSSASAKTINKLACFYDSDATVHLVLRSKSHALIGSAQLGITGDLTMAKGLGGVSGGHVYIVDGIGAERDSLGWGSVDVNSEGKAAVISSINTDHVLERKQTGPGLYTDTNDNFVDFDNSVLRAEYVTGAIDEVVDVCSNIGDIQVLMPSGYYRDTLGDCVPMPVDACINIDGLQATILAGYGLDGSGNCQVDVCQNIDGLQLILPDGMELDNSGGCVVHDECSNLPEIQAVIPDGYKREVDNKCILDLLPLQITELLPNATGDDDGNEYIEIFNPNDSYIDLANYVFYIGTNNTVPYSFPTGSRLAPGQYSAFFNNDINFTLVNTVGSVRLNSIDNILIDETSVYDSPKDDMAWALIDNIWQYTDQPTPGSENIPSVFIELVTETVVEYKLEACAVNQYRSLETNRCRLISTVSSASILAPCKDGQYRSEETNRCRNILSDVAVLAPCAEGQERNPETNRCRSIATVLGANDLVPCKAGQERNPETNRCRNVVGTVPQAEYAPEQSNESSKNYILWWSLIGVGVVAIGYGVWEWRQEIMRLCQKLGSLLHFKK